jgi:hypothetical protein
MSKRQLPPTFPTVPSKRQREVFLPVPLNDAFGLQAQGIIQMNENGYFLTPEDYKELSIQTRKLACGFSQVWAQLKAYEAKQQEAISSAPPALSQPVHEVGLSLPITCPLSAALADTTFIVEEELTIPGTPRMVSPGSLEPPSTPRSLDLGDDQKLELKEDHRFKANSVFLRANSKTLSILFESKFKDRDPPYVIRYPRYVEPKNIATFLTFIVNIELIKDAKKVPIDPNFIQLAVISHWLQCTAISASLREQFTKALPEACALKPELAMQLLNTTYCFSETLEAGIKDLHQDLHQFLCKDYPEVFISKASILNLENIKCLIELLLVEDLYFPFSEFLTLYFHFLNSKIDSLQEDKRPNIWSDVLENVLKKQKYKDYFLFENMDTILNLLKEQKIDRLVIRQFMDQVLDQRIPPSPSSTSLPLKSWPTLNNLIISYQGKKRTKVYVKIPYSDTSFVPLGLDEKGKHSRLIYDSPLFKVDGLSFMVRCVFVSALKTASPVEPALAAQHFILQLILDSDLSFGRIIQVAGKVCFLDKESKQSPSTGGLVSNCMFQKRDGLVSLPLFYMNKLKSNFLYTRKTYQSDSASQEEHYLIGTADVEVTDYTPPPPPAP